MTTTIPPPVIPEVGFPISDRKWLQAFVKALAGDERFESLRVLAARLRVSPPVDLKQWKLLIGLIKGLSSRKYRNRRAIIESQMLSVISALPAFAMMTDLDTLPEEIRYQRLVSQVALRDGKKTPVDEATFEVVLRVAALRDRDAQGWEKLLSTQGAGWAHVRRKRHTDVGSVLMRSRPSKALVEMLLSSFAAAEDRTQLLQTDRDTATRRANDLATDISRCQDEIRASNERVRELEEAQQLLEGKLATTQSELTREREHATYAVETQRSAVTSWRTVRLMGRISQIEEAWESSPTVAKEQFLALKRLIEQGPDQGGAK